MASHPDRSISRRTALARLGVAIAGAPAILRGRYRVFAGAATVLPSIFGNAGLWSAFLIFLLARALFLGLLYWRADAGAAFARGAT